MKFFIYSFLLIIGSSEIVFAQGDGPLLYTMVSNEPLKSRNFSIGLDPIVLDLFDPNLSINAGVRGYWRIKNSVALEGSYRIAYLDRLSSGTTEESRDEVLPVYESRPAQEAEILARFYAVKKLVPVKEKVIVKAERRSDFTINYVAPIPAERLQLVALRLGFISGLYQHATDSDAPFVGHYVDQPERKFNEERDISYPLKSVNLVYKTLSLGISRTRIRNVVVDFEWYGKRSNQSYTEIYFDVLYAPFLKFDNIYEAGVYDSSDPNYSYSDYREVDINDTEKLRAGGRVGISFHKLRTFASYVKFEGGVRPGRMDLVGQLYLLMVVGLNLNFRI